jgi:anthranilate phosphoribosyltransferase
MQLPRLSPEQLAGGSTVEEASGIFTSILKGDSTEAQRAAVLANAALAIGTFHPGRRFTENLEEAAASLDSGEALKRFEALRDLSAVSLN